ncbi:hypothetical protein ABN034_33930 [Actinopolymorpha sp. B11F2]|uniref:hypothetical protein n=1 Tax=Actinopolymorpha sp. B11F2 TaxID=3160862 RepID=UPI0032E37304
MVPGASTELKGQPVRRSNFSKVVQWIKTVADLSLPGLHFHDLRHTGNVLAAQTTGATLRDLMARTGHDIMRAARSTSTSHVMLTGTSRRPSQELTQDLTPGVLCHLMLDSCVSVDG